MRIAIYARGGEFQFFDMDSALLEAFKEKHKEAHWRIVQGLDGFTSVKQAKKFCEKVMRERITRFKYSPAKPKRISAARTEKKCGAYRIVGSLKSYYKARAKMDATKMIGTKVL